MRVITFSRLEDGFANCTVLPWLEMFSCDRGLMVSASETDKHICIQVKRGALRVQVLLGLLHLCIGLV